MDKLDKSSFAVLGLGVAIGCGLGWHLRSRATAQQNAQSSTKGQQKPSATGQTQLINSAEYARLRNEQLVRNIQFFGEEGQQKVNDSYVIVFGVGGVGSHVIASLARSGVGHLRIIDFDRVSLSSLNRHAFATQKDVGRSKVECVREYIQSIMPSTTVEIFEEFVTKDNVDNFFVGEKKPSYVVDCIDNIDAKAELLAYCKNNKHKVISSMGAGMKADPTRIQIRDISDTNYDDLSRAVRQKLKKYRITDGIKVVLSIERNERELLPLNKEQERNPDEYKVFSNYRLRIVPVLGTMPAIFAYAISSYVLCDLAGQLYKPFVADEVKHANYAKVHNVITQEAKNHGVSIDRQTFDMEDVYVLCREVYEWTEVIKGKKAFGGLLTRWNPEGQFVPENFAFLGLQDAKKHAEYKTFEEVKAAYSQEVLDAVTEKGRRFLEFVSKKPVLYK